MRSSDAVKPYFLICNVRTENIGYPELKNTKGGVYLL